MIRDRLAQLRQTLIRLFPERQIQLQTKGCIRALNLSSRQQVGLAGGAMLLGFGALLTVVVGAVDGAGQGSAIARTRGYYERLLADRDARLNSAMARLSRSSGAVLADTVEKRHAALALLFAQLNTVAGQGGPVLRPAASVSPVDPIRAVRQDQERLVATAETAARSRAERLRLALKLAGLDPSAMVTPRTDAGGMGGPLIEAKDPRALAAVLDVDEDFARRIQGVARDLSAARELSAVASSLPLRTPVADPVKSSAYGFRSDPFTHEAAFHPGQDFSGHFMQPIFTTAPGVVSFTGQRTGYGNTVEIDHGHGFKTRYGHLAAIAVKIGQGVALDQRIGAMGSTGRSTGVHLHYEVWQNGKLQDPSRFLKAGKYIAG